MNNQWNIDKLMIWRTNCWSKCDTKYVTLILRIHYDQLMIMSETTVLETFNTHSKIKGIYKDDIMILIISANNQEIRKIKFQIKTNVAHCMNTLGGHFPVMNHNSLQSKNTVISKYITMDAVMKHAFKNDGSGPSVPLPPDYGSFIKICLLDPTFPQTILETNRILEEILKSQ